MKDTLKLLPLFLLYACVILIAATPEYQWDESRYAMFASNLAQGHYSPKDRIDLWMGPGYPIVLLPFFLFKLPILAAKLLNAVFLFAAIIYFYHTLCLYLPSRHATVFAYLLGLYYPFLRIIHLLHTECLVLFLVCGFIFHLCKIHQARHRLKSQIAITSFYVGYLALTKVFFGYVFWVSLIILVLFFVISRRRAVLKVVMVYGFGLALCLPYLTYTYALTGKFFYWGNAGGMMLYWLSSPHKNDLGDWHTLESVDEMPQLSENHQAFFNKVLKLDGVKRDAAFKEQAKVNMQKAPLKYLYNWACNIGRLLFNYPFSYTPQKLSTYFYIFPNMFLFVVTVLCIYPAYLGKRYIPFEFYILILFSAIAVGGLSLLSTKTRYLQPIIPVMVLWISFTISRLVKIKMR